MPHQSPKSKLKLKKEVRKNDCLNACSFSLPGQIANEASAAALQLTKPSPQDEALESAFHSKAELSAAYGCYAGASSSLALLKTAAAWRLGLPLLTTPGGFLAFVTSTLKMKLTLGTPN